MTLIRPPAWEPSTPFPTLKPNEVHLWKIDLDLDETSIPPAQRLLSRAERERGDRFVTETLRRRFVATRAGVRRILAGYVQSDPEALEFESNPYGKPSLTVPGDSAIQFNLTHSKGLALLAVASGRPLGVDLELIRPLSEMEGICQRFFTTADRSLVEDAPSEHKLSTFYRVWTRMEAYGKAVGTGISLPLMPRPFIDPDKPSLLANQPHDLPGPDTEWSLVQFEIDSMASVAVVVEGSGWELRGFEYPRLEA